MKKNYLFLLLSFVAFLGFNQSAWAQTTIAEGLIKVSDATNEYWYYIENGHSSGTSGVVNDNDGRFCLLMTMGGRTNDDVSVGIVPLQVNSARDEQKWKVVASGVADQYYLINKSDNGYLKAITADSYRFRTVPSQSEGDKFTFTVYGTFVKIEDVTQSSRKVEGQNSGSGYQVVATTGGNPTLNTTSGLTGNPRAWHFVEADKVDSFYPTFHEQGTSPTEATKWFYIKTLDTNSIGKCVTAGTSGFSLADKAEVIDDNQLFAFISGGAIGGAEYTSGPVMYIYNKGTGKYISTSGGLSETASNLYIKHVYSTKNEAQPMQGIIKTQNRAGNFFTSNNDVISMESIATIADTYDNGSAWKYEIASFSVNVTQGANATITTTNIPTTVESGTPLEITYKVGPATPDGFTYVPVVTVNGGDPLSATLPDGDGVYTLSLIVADNTTISIGAEKAQNEITFDLTGAAGVTINSPVLEGGKFTTGNVLSVVYSLTDGYTVPTITATPSATIGTATFADGKYTVAVSGITGNTTLAFANAVITYGVTLPESGNGINVVTTSTEANYFDDYTFTFTVADGYNHPRVFVGKDYVNAAQNEDGSYTVTISDVRANFAITVSAFQFAENVLPVVADTYTNGRDNLNKSTEDKLWLQYSSSTYWRRIYLEFDLTQMDMSAYNHVSLEMVCKKIEKPTKSETTNISVAEVPTTLPAINEMTSGNTPLQTNTVSDIVSWKQNTTTVGDILSLNVSDHIFANPTASSLRLQVAPFTDGDGYYEFYSIEGAITANNKDYIPALVFEKRPEVTVTVDGVDITSPAGTSPYVVKTGEDFVLTFTLAEGFKAPVSVTAGALTEEGGIYTLTLTAVNADTTIEISATSISTGFDTASKAKVSVYTEGSNLIVKSAQAAVFEVYSVSGQLVAKQTVNGESSIALNKGVYLVKVIDQVYKVNLK